MKIQLSKSDLKASTQSWNTLTNRKNKTKNYYTPATIEDYTKFDKNAPRLKINLKDWILSENASQAFNEIVNRVYSTPGLNDKVCYSTVYIALKKELEVEICANEEGCKNKREFHSILEQVKYTFSEKVSDFDFFFSVEGLQLENLEIVGCGRVEIFTFEQQLQDQLISIYFGGVDPQDPKQLIHVQDFFNENFLNKSCIKSTAYGDYEIAHKKAYKQARDLINYFRYVLCLLIHERVSEQILKINISFESYKNSERTLVRKHADDSISLISGRGRRARQTFIVDQKRLDELAFNFFLEDFIDITNSSTKTQIEGCILTAIYWIGEAQNEVDLDVSFLKYWTALECIFTGFEQPTHALAKGIATLNMFRGNELAEAEHPKEVYKDMKSLYDKRSDIIHRGLNYLTDQIISNTDVSRICKYTSWSILCLFELRSIGYRKMQEINEHIDKLYSQWNSQK